MVAVAYVEVDLGKKCLWNGREGIQNKQELSHKFTCFKGKKKYEDEAGRPEVGGVVRDGVCPDLHIKFERERERDSRLLGMLIVRYTYRIYSYPAAVE